jgi:excisionase family DNA binding protein
MKDIYTTGEAAEICQVSQQTIIRCFDSGKLGGFRVPGSRFRRIPRKQLIDFMQANNISIDRMGGGKTKVLVVDDDVHVLEIIEQILHDDGRFETRTASTGYDAGVQTHEFLPDVILLDYKLPDINGNVVCRTIRSNPQFSHTKIIIVSGVINTQEVNEMIAEGADGFVQKPFRAKDLVDRVEVVSGLLARRGA